jgi:hypothetical protein
MLMQMDIIVEHVRYHASLQRAPGSSGTIGAPRP